MLTGWASAEGLNFSYYGLLWLVYRKILSGEVSFWRDTGWMDVWGLKLEAVWHMAMPR
jgi:hypothetical protein